MILDTCAGCADFPGELIKEERGPPLLQKLYWTGSVQKV